MTDVSKLSDSELLAMYAMPGLIQRESGGRAGVLGPQTRYGQAQGMTQMLPATAQATAKRMGVNWQPELMTGNSPEAAEYQQLLGEAYLREGIETTGNLEDGLRYYHGGPNRGLWGPKTDDYATSIVAGLSGGIQKPTGPGRDGSSDLADLSDEDLLALYQTDKPKPAAVPPAKIPQRAASSKSGGVTIDILPPEDDPTIAQDVWSGVSQPFKTLGNSVMSEYRRTRDNAVVGPPASLADLGKRTVDDLLSTPRMIGDVLGIASAPVQAAIRPIARGINRLPLRPMTQDTPFSAPRAMQGEEAQGAIEGALNSALSGIRPAASRRVPAARPKPMALEELTKANEAAWSRVDASGYRFPKNDVQGVAADVRTLVNDAGPELYPEADKIARRIEALADRGDLTPAQANRLRSQVGEKLLAPGSTEGSIGGAIKSRIDALIDTANDPALKEARGLYTRLTKMREVTNRIESGTLAQETAGTGGNQNAVRQKLRPLIDPKSPQRIRNLTKDETKALRRVTKGTKTQNALRLLTAFDPTAGKLQAMLSGGAAVGSGGMSLALAPVGMAAKVGEQALATKSLQQLLDLISVGGSAVKPKPTMPIIGRVPLASPGGVVGLGVTAAPLARIPSESPSRKTASKVRR